MESRHDITRIHGVLVLDETEAVHELDLGDLASSMGGEMLLNVTLSSSPWEIPQIETCARHFAHCGGLAGSGDES
jgi:hypothetical protein